MPRTIRHFTTDKDLESILNSWSSASGFRVVDSSDGIRRYQKKGYGFFTAPMIVEIRENAGQVSLQSWIRLPVFNRLVFLYLVPAELGIEPGVIGVVPRMIARKSVNRLLQALDQPPVT